MKYTFFASAFSNHSYNRSEEFETSEYGYTDEDWDEMTPGERESILNYRVQEWLYEDIDVGWEEA